MYRVFFLDVSIWFFICYVTSDELSERPWYMYNQVAFTTLSNPITVICIINLIIMKH